MTAEAFRAQMRIQPFRRFLVKTTDDDTFLVEHPDYAMISPNETEVIVYEMDNHYRVVSMDQIVTIEPVREQPRKSGRK